MGRGEINAKFLLPNTCISLYVSHSVYDSKTIIRLRFTELHSIELLKAVSWVSEGNEGAQHKKVFLLLLFFITNLALILCFMS